VRVRSPPGGLLCVGELIREAVAPFAPRAALSCGSQRSLAPGCDVCGQTRGWPAFVDRRLGPRWRLGHTQAFSSSCQQKVSQTFFARIHCILLTLFPHGIAPTVTIVSLEEGVMPRLHILTPEEAAVFETPPVFSALERERFFQIPESFAPLLASQRTFTNQVCLVLTLGYFRPP